MLNCIKVIQMYLSNNTAIILSIKFCLLQFQKQSEWVTSTITLYTLK